MRSITSVCLTLVAAMATAGSAMAQDATRVYDFNDLTVSCGWAVTSTGLYQDLTFPATTYMARCNTTNGTVGLVPSALAGGRVEVPVQLPAPASTVSIESYVYQAGAAAPMLVAYDENGVELGRDEDTSGTVGVWRTLSVSAAGENPIVAIGLVMPQVVNYLDNLTVNYGWTTGDPEPEPEPDVEPQGDSEGSEGSAVDPVSLADCQNGGWMAFGFSNQGQCVSFVRNGRDSR